MDNLIQSATDPSQCIFPTADGDSAFQFVILRECSYSQLSGEYSFEDDNTVRHSSGKCLSTDSGFVKLVACEQGTVPASQQWQVIA